MSVHSRAQIMVFSIKFSLSMADLQRRFIVRFDGTYIKLLNELTCWWCSDLKPAFERSFDACGGLAGPRELDFKR